MAISVSIPGYTRVNVSGARALVLEPCADALRAILGERTLYEHAKEQEGARTFRGRVTAYSLDLGTGCGSVVVRHAVRGGILGRTGWDLFFPPTRGLRELVNSLRLRLYEVATPEVIAIVSYSAGAILRRSDVATREIGESHDLSVVLREVDGADDRESCLRATGRLLASLTRAGAHHPDLNARNVLVTWDARAGAQAHVIDVDRIRFHAPGDPMVADANFQRLERSLNKLASEETLPVTPAEIAIIREGSLETSPADD